MTETRKQIAELIGVSIRESEYGILNGNEVRLLNEALYVDIGGIVCSRNGVKIDPIYEFVSDCSYDITAVIKYITQCYKGSAYWSFCTYGEYISFDNGASGIPNKPLYFYTEEEDKDLLELLQKIGQK